ncbi:uncharacterized protein TRIADDRAFT_52362 [Trichoplax adhaerens]|uniref:SSD domain-containing protein n=1 Tax=Trichoplax adhaerens TaxID=10228 RepID=B3RI30_TRIAD|nr:hypothetical protein TRIADDRAFT_52362 [Trichoplax adhaerens]EDV28963.1 hypothetical protein TRIADDRAFT_52362 [Trichoplax adhaerens]|eukprot:XP_002108165.1 hypothetical protein TRIADDRAFT_52362 [Trichoplax adhaerens]
MSNGSDSMFTTSSNQTGDVDSNENTQGHERKNKTSSLSLLKISALIVHLLETLFYRIGLLIGRHPYHVVVTSIVCVAFCSLGFLRFTEENRIEKLWVPSTADSLVHMEWVDKNFPSNYHIESLVCVANTKSTNVIKMEPLHQFLLMHEAINNITVNSNGTEYKFEDLCYKRGGKCWVDSVLSVWNFNSDIIASISDHQIEYDLNKNNMYIPKKYIKRLLGNTTELDGHIESASAFLSIYRIKDNSILKRGAKVDEIADEWESRVESETAKSFAADSVLLSIGYVIILIFVSCALGRLNRLENRNIVAAMGMICIAMAYAAAVGISSLFGLLYGPLHAVLPFLLLGIGVDDMFVIATAWDNFKHHAGDRTVDIAEHAGQCLKKAGVSITVTSLTDVVAFTIGASTVLPALSSFSIFAGIGILAVFILQITFFTACIVLDSRRRNAGRDACLPCLKVKKHSGSKKTEKSWSSKIFDGGILRWFFGSKFAPFLLKGPNKFFVVLITLDLVAVSIYGSIELKVSFDPRWFLAPDSYGKKFVQYQEKYFPDEGAPLSVYLGKMDYFTQQQELANLSSVIKKEKSIQNKSVSSWFDDYILWMKSTSGKNDFLNKDGYVKNKTIFYEKLHSFLNTVGRHYSQDIVFNDSDPQIITASRFHAVHKLLSDTSEELKALDSIRTHVSAVPFSPNSAFAFSKYYHLWETNRIDMGGLMYFWELSINTVTTIVLVLVVGLSVDYAAHMAHTFMRYQGTRKERVLATMGDMAPAVFNGGFSTFLAFILLAGSTNYGFLTFFKMFFGVVVFGLFHGLCFLPVLLSWIGADSYPPLAEDSPLTIMACGSCKCWRTFSRILKNFFCKKRETQSGGMVDNCTQTSSCKVECSDINFQDDLFIRHSHNDIKYESYSSGVGSSANSSLCKIATDSMEDMRAISTIVSPSEKVVITSPKIASNTSTAAVIDYLNSEFNVKHFSHNEQKNLKNYKETSV